MKQQDPAKVGADATASRSAGLLQECSSSDAPLLPSQRFPMRQIALQRARDRREGLLAVARFAFAGFFVRHAAGNYCELTRDAVANEAWCYLRMSPAGKCVRALDFAAVVARMDDKAREFSRG